MKVSSVDLAAKTIGVDSVLLARVAIMGAKRGTGWRYTWYEASHIAKSGYIYAGYYTAGMYPNEVNKEISTEIEEHAAKTNLLVVVGRPVAGKNAPMIEK